MPVLKLIVQKSTLAGVVGALVVVSMVSSFQVPLIAPLDSTLFRNAVRVCPSGSDNKAIVLDPEVSNVRSRCPTSTSRRDIDNAAGGTIREGRTNQKPIIYPDIRAADSSHRDTVTAGVSLVREQSDQLSIRSNQLEPQHRVIRVSDVHGQSQVVQECDLVEGNLYRRREVCRGPKVDEALRSIKTKIATRRDRVDHELMLIGCRIAPPNSNLATLNARISLLSTLIGQSSLTDRDRRLCIPLRGWTVPAGVDQLSER